MDKIRYGLIVLSMLLCWVTSATAQVSIGIGLPNVSIGINLPLFPQLVRVPDYPVYYAPSMDANYFFYDGMYWVYQDDNWYASTWYNGPWSFVAPEVVPLFVLRVPVRYYRQPPMYFRGWQSNAPPRWGQHWGHGWEQHRRGWDRWNRSSAPAPAPLPVYQRKYSGERYPQVERQHTLRSQSYRYQPRDKAVRQHLKQQVNQKTPAAAQQAPVPAQQRRQETPPSKNPRQQDIQRSAPHQPVAPPAAQQTPVPAQQRRQEAPPSRNPKQQDIQRSAPHQQVAPPAAQQHQQPQRQGVENIKKSAPPQPPPQQQAPAVRDQRQQPRGAQQEQKQKNQDREDSQEPNRGRGQGRGQDQQDDDDRGRGRNR